MLKLYICMNTILAICPFKEDCIQSKLYGLVLLGAFSSLSMYVFTFRVFFFPAVISLFEQFLASAAIGVMVVFYGNLLYKNLKSRKSWKILLAMLIIFDNELPGGTLYDFNKKWSISLFVLIRFLPIIYSINDLILWSIINKELFILALPFYSLQHPAIFYEFQITCFLWEMSNLLESRYQHLKECLTSMLLAEELNQQISHYKLEMKIEKFKFKYSTLYRVVEEVNNIFGTTILSLQLHLSTLFLMDFYWMVDLLGGSKISALEGGLFTVMVMVSLTKKSPLPLLIFLSIMNVTF